MPTEQKSIKKTYLTIDDIAAMAGVSKSTVSRVLNNSGFVSEKTRTKVMDIVEANHYIPNSMARELGRTSTQSIGIFIGNISNSYYSEILSGAEAAINRSSFFPFICVVSNERREEFYVQEMLKRRTSGILFASMTIYNLDAIAQLLRSTHAVSIQTDIPHVPRIDCENRLGTQRIVEHLIALGHQKIAFLTFQNPTMVLSQRFEGYSRPRVLRLSGRFGAAFTGKSSHGDPLLQRLHCRERLSGASQPRRIHPRGHLAHRV